jgi:hypothetical protein
MPCFVSEKVFVKILDIRTIFLYILSENFNFSHHIQNKYFNFMPNLNKEFAYGTIA